MLCPVALNVGEPFTLEFTAPRSVLATAVSGFWASSDPHVLRGVVSGVAFLVDVRRPGESKIIGPAGVFIAAHRVLDQGLLLLASPWQLAAIRGYDQLWQSPRLAADGFIIKHTSGIVLHGIDGTHDSARDFELDLGAGELLG